MFERFLQKGVEIEERRQQLDTNRFALQAGIREGYMKPNKFTETGRSASVAAAERRPQASNQIMLSSTQNVLQQGGKRITLHN